MMNAWFDYLLIGILFLLTAGLFFSLLRAIRGPRMADRILGINMTGSLTTAAIAELAAGRMPDLLHDQLFGCGGAGKGQHCLPRGTGGI